MVNLDSAEENSVIIGCCGGIRTELTLPVKREKGEFKGYKITIGGLCGGHSGEDIDKNRLNAHILMGKIKDYYYHSQLLELFFYNHGKINTKRRMRCGASF